MHLFEMHARTCRFYFVCCIWHNNCPSWLKPWKVYWSSTKHLPNIFVQSKTDMHKITSIWIVRLPSATFSPLPLSICLFSHSFFIFHYLSLCRDSKSSEKNCDKTNYDKNTNFENLITFVRFFPPSSIRSF